MVESGSFPNSESDDPQALNQDAFADAPEHVDDEHTVRAEVEADFADAAASETESESVEASEAAEPATPGGFDKFRSAAVAAAGWSLEKATIAAVQGANLARGYPRAALASGLSVLILGGVLAIAPSKKAPVVQVPGQEANVDENQAKADDQDDPNADPKPETPKRTAETASPPADDPAHGKSEQIAATEPDAGTSKTTKNDPAPAPELTPHPELDTHPASASLLTTPKTPDPTPADDPVKPTAGVGDPGLPELPPVDELAGDLPKVDTKHQATPDPALPIAEAPGHSPVLELAHADVKPGDAPHEDVPAPVPPPTTPTLTPETAPAPSPSDVKPTAEPKAAPAPAPAPTPIGQPATPPTPAPSPAESAPVSPQIGNEPKVQPPATTPDLGMSPAPAPAGPSVVPTPSPAAVPAPNPAAPAKEAVGGLTLGGFGAAAGAAMKNLGAKPAEPASPPLPADAHNDKPTDAHNAKPAEPASLPLPTDAHNDKSSTPPAAVEPPPTAAPEQTPGPKPSSGPPISAPSAPNSTPVAPIPTAPAPAPAAAASGDIPSFNAVPEGGPSSAVDKPASTPPPSPTAEAKPNPTAEPSSNQGVTPIRRSGNILIHDIGRDDGFDDDPSFDRRDGDRTTDPDAHADKEMNFEVETYSPRSQSAGRDGRGAQASALATAKSAGKIDTVLHKVESGENFFTISQSYYNSGRYYRALAKANSDQFKKPEALTVGAVIRVPPPEDLDPAFIDPPGTRYGSNAQASASSSRSPKTADAAASKDATPIRRSRRANVELNLPVSDPATERASDEAEPAVDRPVARRRGLDRDDEFDRDGGRAKPETASRNVSTRPVHKVQPYETLRTIARDRLGNGRRANEILELNRDAIDDPSDLIVGQILELPDDARVARPKSRR
jgi:nucleoid-associated protein YgaU